MGLPPPCPLSLLVAATSAIVVNSSYLLSLSYNHGSHRREEDLLQCALPFLLLPFFPELILCPHYRVFRSQLVLATSVRPSPTPNASPVPSIERLANRNVSNS